MILGCFNEDCQGRFELACRNHDQIVYCGKCEKAFMFVNVCTTNCPSCKITVRCSITGSDVFGLCDCGKRLSLRKGELTDANLRVYRLRMHEMSPGYGGSEFADEIIQYCGRDSFEGSEDEVKIAKIALEKIERDGGRSIFSKKRPVMFLRINRRSPSAELRLPINELRLVHAACNFSLSSGHRNAKYYGFLAAFSSGKVINDLIRDYGLTDIWVNDQEIQDSLCCLPTFRDLKKRFRVLR